MDRHLIFYYIGIMIVLISHIYMLVYQFDNMEDKIHASVNLFAVCCIAYYFMNKEGYIHF